MSDSREFNAATVEEAVAKASESLGVSEKELSFEVLDPGSAGFLGIGARDARISVDLIDSDDAEVPDTDIVATVPPLVDEVEPSISGEPAPEQDDGEKIEASEELLEEVREHVSSVVEAMGLSSRIDVYDAGDYIAVDMVSDHTALLIGQKGETIDSLQYLVNSAIYRDRMFVKRVVLDSEGYRQRRIEAIQGMAHRTARKSIREQRKINMPPMNSSERRVVHVYLKDNPEVTTSSEGMGDERRVTVSPD